VEATEITGAHVHVKTLSGAVSLTDVRDSHVDIHSTSGDITIRNVTASFVEVGSGSGQITYDGDPGPGGYYRLTSHTGDLDVSIPASAAVEIKSGSLKGDSDQAPSSVDHVPPMDQRNMFVKSGMVGVSRIVLRSFKEKIRLKRP
jgi:hypothetical protein